MKYDGERLRELFLEAETQVIICAPFMKANIVAKLLKVIPKSASLQVITRWRAEEVTAGVSDLDVFDIVRARDNSNIFLLDNLHAKLFVSDRRCLAGSANVTGAALGWSDNPNVEILLDCDTDNLDVKNLLLQLKDAIPATFQIKSDIQAKADKIAEKNLKNSLKDKENLGDDEFKPWFPRCATPEKLFFIYENAKTKSVTYDTRDDAFSDLKDLNPPKNLSEPEFIAYCKSILHRMPTFAGILGEIPAKLTDEGGIELIRSLHPNLSDSDLQRQWEVMREWICVFFADKFEVAPDRFVLRIKS